MSGELLFGAAVSNQIATFNSVLKECLINDVDVNFAGSNGRTALHVVCSSFCNNRNMVLHLMEAGIDVNKRNHTSENALQYAIGINSVEMVSLLLKLGAIASAPRKSPFHDSEWSTALHSVARRGNKAMAILLLNHEVSVDILDCSGRTPMYVAIDWKCFHLVYLFLDYGADVKRRDAAGQTVLHYACRKGRLEIISRLLQQDGIAQIINHADKHGRTALHLSVNKKHNKRIVKMLLDHGADPDIVDENGQTALHMAARIPEAHKTVALLLTRGANANIRDHSGLSALQIALEKQPMIALLLQYGGGAGSHAI